MKYKRDKTRRVNALIPNETFQMLEELAIAGRMTMTSVLDKAIRLKTLVDDVYKENGELLVKKGNKIQELTKELYARDLI
jgi:predicted ATPase